MAIFSTGVSVTSAGTTLFAADALSVITPEWVYVVNNSATACFLGGGTSLASGGGTSGGLPITSTSLALPMQFGSTDRLFGITASGGTADVRVMLFTPSR